MLDTCQTCETPDIETEYEFGVLMCQECLALLDSSMEEELELQGDY